MKKIKYIIMAMTGVLFASCMGSDYAEPASKQPEIKQTNVISIDSLKTIKEYSTAINGNSYKEITEDIQILATVTGNDAQGNFYNQISLQDKTGGILVRIGKGGLYGDLPVGQQILLNLKGLYIGGYGKQAQLGMLFEGSVGKIDRFTWPTLYGKVGNIDLNYKETLGEEFDVTKMSDADYIAKHAGRLMTIKNVSFQDANGKNVYAPKDGSATVQGGSVNRALNEYNSRNIVVRTSTFADFANAKLPSGKQNITGIFTRYNNTWQITLLSADDVQTANKYQGIDGTGEGTIESPYDIARALSLIAKGAHNPTEEVYITGIISDIKSISLQYKNADYYLSDDGKTDKQLMVFRGKYLNGADFTAEDQIKVGQKVTIVGKLKLYNTTPEVEQGNKIISIK